jgi:hypothetical protein
MVRKINCMLAACFLILRAASGPFRMGIATSATMTSGFRLKAASIKAWPLGTKPTTGYVRSSKTFKAGAKITWSSAIRKRGRGRELSKETLSMMGSFSGRSEPTTRRNADMGRFESSKNKLKQGAVPYAVNCFLKGAVPPQTHYLPHSSLGALYPRAPRKYLLDLRKTGHVLLK